MRPDALELGRGVPAALLRVVILLAGAAIVVVPLQEGITIGTLFLLLPAVLASAYAPASPAPAAVIVVVAVLLALAGEDPLRAEVLVMIPLVHLFHVACGLAGVLPASGRVHLRALRSTALRFLLVQAVTAAVVVLVALLPTGRTHPVVEVLGLAGLAGVVLVVVWRQRVK
ncbi:hypothetical protein [Actinophytocola algeriensis]|uniref:Uncharacterized protein n=1 Tax=Actinophytocola algeriensis TaxID=1768010 RepID=A0A7W7VIG8_9PSEU|nr:hypothetical protein [Actinophytocola algeriensis]MBB4911249.1 hypothetical protein [Actinophytocola algeriensis]MBE1479188.1 hypothetical protein [Actinophytocola algeriensis]